jgi:hypothetical protein
MGRQAEFNENRLMLLFYSEAGELLAILFEMARHLIAGGSS